MPCGNFNERETRRAFRTLIRLLIYDAELRIQLSQLVQERVENGIKIPDIYDPVPGKNVDSVANLSTLPAWAYLKSHDSEKGAWFIAEVAWEMENRPLTKKYYPYWRNFEISEYVIRKIRRQMESSKQTAAGVEYWWKYLVLCHVIHGLGPWPVGDSIDDDQSGQLSTKTETSKELRTFSTGPFPRGDGTG
ncbi:MAG: hypothetical protein ACFFDQ_10495 [Candidatus Thorarchaeota archaeon]